MSQTILITGCSTGFGFQAAKHLSEKGHHVYATMRGVQGKNSKAAAELVEFAKAKNLKLDVLELDVTSDDSVAATFENVSRVDVLINNAGVGLGGPIEAFTSDQFAMQLDVNVTGTFRVAKAALPAMRAQKSGLIIQVSSIAGRIAGPGFGVYHASKWALEGLGESMRYELAAFGIDVVLVEPGPFSTNFFGNIVAPKDEKLAAAYQHVSAYFEEFGQKVQGAFEDTNAPTDPQIVVDVFEKLINTPAGKRPLRTIAGLGFGSEKLNEAVEPIRKQIINELGIANWDGPSA